MSLRHYLAALVSLLLATSCSDDSSSVSNGAGTLSLEVSVDATLRDPVTGAPTSVRPYVPAPSEIRLSMASASGIYSHTWTSLSDFPERQHYLAGPYRLEASFCRDAEGFETPAYIGTATPVVVSDRHVNCPLTLWLESSVFAVDFGLSASASIDGIAAIFHTPGNEYYTVAPQESRLLYLQSGPTDLYLDVCLSDGRKTRFKALSLTDTKAACFYACQVSLDESGVDPAVTCVIPGVENVSFTLSPAFLAANPPVIENSGWNLDAALIIPEGELPVEPVVAIVSSDAPLAHLWLSVASASLSALSLPTQVDLLNLTSSQAAVFSSLGLKLDLSSCGGTVNFTDLIGKLVFLTEDEALSSFCLLAEDSFGRVSAPASLRVITTEVDIEVLSVDTAPVGSTAAGITVRSSVDDFASNIAVEILEGDVWCQAEVFSVTPSDGGSSYSLRFVIPDGNADISARLLYCDEIRAEFTVERTLPRFDLEIDPFATYALVRVTADDRQTVECVTDRLMLYVNGERGAILMRDAERGVLALTDLEPNKTYTLTSTMMDRPDASDFTPAQRFATEKAPSLPNSDFEDRKDGISYDRMPSGGRYSQTTVPLFNWQNTESFSLQVPEKWANTNSKTFCSRATNHNTWYLQPSAFTVRDEVQSGEFAVCLRSVGFDLNGEDIPDYTQTGQPYLKYSPVVPHVSLRAAGKLFLGEYSFNSSTLEETYRDVVGWTSRPRSLNGFYKYNPSPDRPSDAGVAIIEVYGTVDGKSQVIASAKTYLPVANGYTAFTAQLSYTHFGVKATGLKVMFASSAAIGTVAEESVAVVTTPDPVRGASLGSTLWLDDISLAY